MAAEHAVPKQATPPAAPSALHCHRMRRLRTRRGLFSAAAAPALTRARGTWGGQQMGPAEQHDGSYNSDADPWHECAAVPSRDIPSSCLLLAVALAVAHCGSMTLRLLSLVCLFSSHNVHAAPLTFSGASRMVPHTCLHPTACLCCPPGEPAAQDQARGGAGGGLRIHRRHLCRTLRLLRRSGCVGAAGAFECSPHAAAAAAYCPWC